ncbi:uncharacterized protein [Apostichopus japonicus]|uniref:uncharacterized protein n=1 Tax=Stichopus japonicus TaxID=307972 RepID=UPI003AB4BA7D
MPRSFLVKSQGYRDKEKKRGLGIAKLVYDPTRAVTVVTTLAKPEPRRPIINYVQSSINPTRWYQSWISTPAISTSCEVTTPPSYSCTETKDVGYLRKPSTSPPFFRPFLPLPVSSRSPRFVSAPPSAAARHLQINSSCFSSSDEESRLSSPGSDCGETFQEKKAFDRRLITGNSRKSTQKLKCPGCGKEYCTAGGLSKHQQTQCRAGQNGRTFQCKYCSKEYTALGALKMHLRTHTLPCKCTICGKAFSRPWLLQGHIRTHTGEKPFSCQHCQRAFADRSNLRAHLQTHSHVKRYSCSLCTRTFSRMSLLNKHTKSGCDRIRVNPQTPSNPMNDQTMLA